MRFSLRKRPSKRLSRLPSSPGPSWYTVDRREAKSYPPSGAGSTGDSGDDASEGGGDPNEEEFEEVEEDPGKCSDGPGDDDEGPAVKCGDAAAYETGVGG